MCVCIEVVNDGMKLAHSNTAISTGIDITTGRERVIIATHKRNISDRKRPVTLYASFCPMCGEKWDAK